MTQYKHILFAADLIPEDDDPVAQKVRSLAAATNAEVTILHVIEDVLPMGAHLGATMITELQQNLNERAKSKLEKMGKQLDVPADRQICVTGYPKSVILEMAEQMKADVVVMGSHARHGLDRILLGSTTVAVLNNAKCDVLAVHV